LHFPGVALNMVHPYSDNDADGLNTLLEFRYRTDPWKYDSDGDGRPDGEEVYGRTDPLTSDPVQTSDSDKDGDGMEDTWESSHFPNQDIKDIDGSADPDGDGLQNFTESKLGTDPNKADSDGDGISDNIEASWKTPGPLLETWHPQPTEPEKSAFDIRVILIIFIIVLLIFLIAYLLYRVLRGSTNN
jgi:hypothetical protein